MLYACGLCLFCLHNSRPYGFITFFSISVVTQDYCARCACDVPSKTYDNCDDSAALAVESKLSTNVSVPVPRKMSRSEEEFTWSLLAAIFNVSSENCEIVMWLCPSRTVTLSAAPKMLCGSRVRKAAKVDLASQRLCLGCHRGESWVQVPTRRYGELSSRLYGISFAQCNLAIDWFTNFPLSESWSIQLYILLYSSFLSKTHPLDPHWRLVIFCGFHWMWYFSLKKISVTKYSTPSWSTRA